jgi:hypothetical protein
MPPAKRVSKAKSKTTVVLDTVIDPTPVPIVEPVVVVEATVTVALVQPAKKPKKQPKIVAIVTPDGIEGSFLPEPRRPLIAHLQVNSTEVKFHDLHYKDSNSWSACQHIHVGGFIFICI